MQKYQPPVQYSGPAGSIIKYYLVHKPVIRLWGTLPEMK